MSTTETVINYFYPAGYSNDVTIHRNGYIFCEEANRSLMASEPDPTGERWSEVIGIASDHDNAYFALACALPAPKAPQLEMVVNGVYRHLGNDASFYRDGLYIFQDFDGEENTDTDPSGELWAYMVAEASRSLYMVIAPACVMA